MTVNYHPHRTDRPGGDYIVVTMTLNGTTPVEETLDLPKGVRNGGCVVFIFGDQSAAQVTITGYHSGLGVAAGAMDFQDVAITIGGTGNGHAMYAFNEQISDNRFVLPRGEVKLRAVSNNASSAGTVIIYCQLEYV
jgi:hypothetical protein